MGTTTRSGWLQAALLAPLMLGPISCGGSSSSPTLVVAAVQPTPFIAYQPTPFTLTGSGFGRRSSGLNVVTVRFVATQGTPFAAGTSAEAVVPGTVVSDTVVQGTSPTTSSPGGWYATVEVRDELGPVTSATPIARFEGLTVGAIDRHVIPSDQATTFEVRGLAFQPVGGQATVRFTASAPVFPGPSTFLDVVANVIDTMHVSGVTPTFPLAAAAPTFVGVTLHQVPGAPSATAQPILTVFTPPPPIPVVVTGISPALPIDVATPFTVTGSGFLGGGVDTDVMVTFTTTSGAPFHQGTANTVNVAGTATSDGVVTGTSPLGTALADFTATVTITRTDSIEGTSATAIAQFLAPLPTVTALMPDAMPANLATAFVITGTNLTGATATVRFRAVSGTPFAGGTSDTADVIATVTSPTQIDGLSPVSVTTEPFLCDVDVILLSGTELNMGPECTFEPPPGPVQCVVTTLANAGPGSLRDTILNATPDCVITFDPSLTGNLNVLSTLVVPQNVRILGPGATVVRVRTLGGDFPVFTIAAGATDTSIALLGIRGSQHSGSGGGCLVQGGLTLVRCELDDHDIGGNGGAVFVGAGATLTLRECTIDNCFVDGLGGAVFVSGGGTAHVIGCMIRNGGAGDGGGAFAVAAAGTLDAVNCTLFTNLSYANGGAIVVPSGATVSLLQCTVVESVAVERGGGVQITGGTFTATSCIFSRNWAGASSQEIDYLSGTNATTFSLVRVGEGSGLTNGVAGNVVGIESAPIDALIGRPAQNGGPTLTMMPRQGSRVIDFADPVACTPKDQRGVARPIGAGCDMGACEADLVL